MASILEPFSIYVTASDWQLATTASFHVIVTPVNDAPMTIVDNAATNEDTPVSVDVVVNDTDAEGDPITLLAAWQRFDVGRRHSIYARQQLQKERRIIADMRERYLGEKALNVKVLPPLLFAGVLLEGGIIGYDSNTRAGGRSALPRRGARHLGVRRQGLSGEGRYHP